MDKALRVAFMVLVLAIPASGQLPVIVTTHPQGGGGVVVTGGGTWMQSTAAVIAANGGTEVQGACGTTGTPCTFKVFPTTQGSALAIGFELVDSQNLTISSAFSCTVSSGCNSGNAIDTFTLCSPTCHINTTNDNVDLAYVPVGAGGATFITVTLSGTPTTPGDVFYYFQEISPPNCNGSPCSIAFDANTHSSANSCGSGCTGNLMSLTGTDMIFFFLDTAVSVSGMVTPYTIEQTGNGFGLDATSAPAFRITTANYYTVSELAFSTAGGSYTPTNGKFNIVNDAPPLNNSLSTNGVSCTPTCTVNFNGFNSVSGDLLFIQSFGDGSVGSGTISSASGRGGTWVVPSAANTCKDTVVRPISCTYTLTNTGGTGNVTLTMSANGTYYFAFYEISRTSGSFLLDTQASGSAGASTATISGQALTIVSPDACFAQFTWNNTSALQNGITLYPYPGGGNIFGGFSATQPAVSAVLINATSGTAPQVRLSTTTTTSESTGICFK